jgi:hypothetical protein
MSLFQLPGQNIQKISLNNKNYEILEKCTIFLSEKEGLTSLVIPNAAEGRGALRRICKKPGRT